MLRLFVGNIPHACGEAELQRWFEERGHSVTFAQVIRDRVTGHSRGFGFVELEDAFDLKSTVESLHGQRLSGRVLTVNAASPRVPGGSALQRTA
jgi:RNA recognition motif-containing protein